jgi:Mn-dependent DtxR family transcriptional regulator
MSKTTKQPATWKSAAKAHNFATIKRPEGCMTLSEIAADMGVSEDKARETVNNLIRSQWAERVPGKMVNAAGAVIAVTYYRLLRTE